MSYQVDENGFYGEFGGAYIPEILYKCVEELRQAYLPVLESEDFQRECARDAALYVGFSDAVRTSGFKLLCGARCLREDA